MISVIYIVILAFVFYGLKYFFLFNFLYLNNIIKKNTGKFIILSFVMGTILTTIDVSHNSFPYSNFNITAIVFPLIIPIIFFKRNRYNFHSIIVGSVIYVLEDFICSTVVDIIFYYVEVYTYGSSIIINDFLTITIYCGINLITLYVLLLFTTKVYTIGTYQYKTSNMLFWSNIIIILLLGSSISFLSNQLDIESMFLNIIWLLVEIIMLSSLILNNNLNNSIIKHKILLEQVNEKNLKIETINKELIETREKIIQKEKFASLGQIAGSIAQNLRSPIMSIAGNLETVNQLVTKYEKTIGDIGVSLQDHYHNAEDMMLWLDKNTSLLNYINKIIFHVINQTRERDETLEEKTSIENIIEKIHTIMDYELKSYKCTLNVINKTDVSTCIHGKPNILIQVINNLISNSIHSYNQHKGIIVLTFETCDKNLVISVEDKGSGIKEEIQKKLFKSMITTKGKDGTGLGLYVSYCVIKGYFSGNITFNSTEGTGSKFVITIPRYVFEKI